MNDRIAPEARFAKHRLLPEIGPRGQSLLSSARFSVDERDPAASFGAMLLERSGLAIEANAPRLVPPPAHEPVEPALRSADDAVRGAIAAVQRIREIVGLERAAHALRDIEDGR